ncbi:MAG: chemotaxis protein CheB [Bacteroidota bacterium]|uniref:protein-glutamate methylesterase n=1 Tax=Pedobacter cryotolerans TaxID=2571270 RepID=A0A4U1C8Y2_9SPHI|nr:chemotaxis protein CheB [Pedobacter cryotolerans]TKC02098.1 chemotaxis protein CheB [Pedobacter cryotolerans]
MKNCAALIIGGSAGSLDVLFKVLPAISTTITFPIIIVVHRKQGTDSLLSNLLATKTLLKVKEVEEKEKVLPGSVYIVPSDYHSLIEKDETFSLDYSEKVNYSRPSIDVTFQSAAEVYQDKLVCLLLSGSNADGVNGLITVKRFGGKAIVQDPLTAQVNYMPAQAILRAKIDKILTIDEMADYINAL